MKEMIVTWQIKPESFQEILELLPTLVEGSRSEIGNRFYNIYQSESDPWTLVLHERYESEEALEAHRSSSHFQEMVVAKVLPALEKREVTFIRQLF